MQEKTIFEGFLNAVEEKTGLKFEREPKDWLIDKLKVVGIGLENAPVYPETFKPSARALDLENYIEVELADFSPDIVATTEKGDASVSFYLVYNYPKPASWIVKTPKGEEKIESSYAGYKAIWLLTLSNLLKQTYGEVHLYIHKEKPQPILLRAKPIGKEYGGLEAYIAPRIP